MATGASAPTKQVKVGFARGALASWPGADAQRRNARSGAKLGLQGDGLLVAVMEASAPMEQCRSRDMPAGR